MKKLQIWQVLLLLPLLVLGACDSDDDPTGPAPGPQITDLMINEFMASNDSHDVDGTGSFPDWIELYNTTAADINIGGWFMTDKITDDVADWFQIPTGSNETVVPAGGWLVLFANKAPGDGPLYLDFKLSGGGETIGLAKPDETVMGSFIYEQQTADISMGLTPDGTATDLVFLVTATPGSANSAGSGNLPPVISDVVLDPVSPLPDEEVNVIAEVFDDNGISSVSLFWNVDGGDWTEVAMTAVTKVTGFYTGAIPAQAVDAVVGYYITATDTDSESTSEPADAPASFATYTPVFQLPFTLYINEFMADNESIYPDGGEYDDPADAYQDWIEIYNPGETAIDIGGMYISDALSSSQEWQIPTTQPDSTTIAPGGYLVLIADKMSERGVLHVEIKLSSSGEDVALFADDGNGHILLVDGYTFTGSTVDISEGRETDGHEDWTTFATPTPGAANGAGK